MLQVQRQIVHLQQSPFHDSLRLLISQSYILTEESPRVDRVRSLKSDGDDNFVWEEHGFFSCEERRGDGIILSPENAQRIVDQLWVFGHRPSEAVGSAGALTAAKDHLADMRRVVTHFLDDNPLAKPLAAANAMNDRISQFAVSQTQAGTAKVVEDQRHGELLAHLRGISSKVCDVGPVIVKTLAELNVVIERIGTLDDGVGKLIAACVCTPRDPLTLDEAFDDPHSNVYKALVAKGWTPPQ